MTKKCFFTLATVFLIALSNMFLQAQISQGGIPLSMKHDIPIPNIPVHNYIGSDWSEYLATEKKMSVEELFSKPQKVGLHIAADIGFPYSGQLSVMQDGTRVWRLAINVDGSPALGVLFDQYKLPKGVKLFLTNANKKQIAGAFDYSNNQASGKFVIDAVQGDQVFLELNIEPSIDLSEINLHIDYVLAFHRAIEHLSQYTTTIDGWDEDLNGLSSVCNINAICPTGANYAYSRRATVQTLDLAPGGGGCSGTLVNSTGNSTSDCKPYIITASHCQGSGSLSNADFDQMIIRFNFERPDCLGAGATNGQSITGVNILARAGYNDSLEADDIKGDFMIYQLRQSIPASYNAVLAGWNRSNTIATNVALPQKFIGFHHPYFDNKKLSTSQSIQSQDWPTEAPIANGNRWFQLTNEGYVGPGSSGSGLFDGDGRLIGIASTASITPNVNDTCHLNIDQDDVYVMDVVWYDKLWHGWEYSVDGTDSNRRIKPWLDAGNTGVMTTDPVTSTCESLPSLSINKMRNELDANISFFPNPSHDGKIHLQYNLKNATDLDIFVLDVNGRIVFNRSLKNVMHGRQAIDISGVANGMYVVKISSGIGNSSKKIMISK